MELTNSIASIAIGSFDGIHRGHRQLIEQSDAVVIIEQNRCTLTPGYQRTAHIQQPCFFYHFENIKSLSAHAFIERLQQDFPKLETIVVGYDFGFGYRKEGDTTLLKELFHGQVIVVDEVTYKGASVHSRTIKQYIKEGDLIHANELLDRPYRVQGEVIKGQGLGSKELVPTLNLKIYDYLLPKEGVYATRTQIENQWLKSVSFFGHRVSTDGFYAIETHIIDRNIGTVQGDITIEFTEFIRENRKFEELAALKDAIARDIQHAKKIHRH